MSTKTKVMNWDKLKEKFLEHFINRPKSSYGLISIVDWLEENGVKELSNEWISVETALPTEKDADENGKVLVYRETNPDQKGLSKCIYDWNMVRFCDNKTHWQALPKEHNT